MSDQAGEKSEKATEKKKADARQKGQVATSREVSVAISLAATVAAGSFLGMYAFGMMIVMLRQWLATSASISVNENTLPMIAAHAGWDLLIITVPFGLILLAMGVGSQILQTGWIWSTEKLKFDLAKISPMAGFKRLFSLRALFELPKSLLKIAVVAIVVYWNLKDEMLALPLMAQMEPQAALFQAGRLAWGLMLWITGAFAVLAAADYAFQRWQFYQDLRMTPQEVKQEHKESEGDPLIRSRIRTLQREQARRRMMQEVPKADVVITNPTHLAVALKYDGARMAAPVVVAKGAGFIAERIRQIAAEHRVPIIENKPLAHSLHQMVDLGREIPTELYHAAAEILAMVIRAKGRV